MNKQKLFEELLKKKGIHTPKGAVLKGHSEPGPYRLSFAQRRIWFLQQFDTRSAAYNDPTALRIKGPLNIPVMERTFNEIISRHKVLSMTFPAQKGQPAMAPHKDQTIAISIIPLPEWPGYEAGKPLETQISDFVNRFCGQPFDLSKHMLIRVSLLKIEDDDYVLVVNIHHIVLDGWSKGIMLRELMDLYEVFSRDQASPLKELPVQFTDYVHWHHEWMQGKLVGSQLAYWQEKLSGAPPVLELPTDHPRPNLPGGGGSLEPFSFTRQKYQALNDLAKQEDVTFFMLMLAAYITLLYRYSGQEDILVGTPIAGRNRVELENLIGLFVNTLVIRCHVSGNPSFKTLLGRVRATALEAYSNQDIPFEKLVEELNPQRSLSVAPLFQVMFQLQNAPMPPAHISGLTITPIQIDTGFSQVDLSLTLWEEQDIMKGTFEYNTDLFEAASIKRMVGHFQVLLEGITADAAQDISHLPLMSAGEKNQLLVEWNDTDAAYPRESCIYQLFESCAEKYPDEEAVIFAQQRLTYDRLNRQANQLAHLLQKMNVGPETLVAVCMENSLQLITGVIGILKAGGAYIPLDPAYPDERLITILKDARSPVLITQPSYLNRFRGYEGKITSLDGKSDITTSECTANCTNKCKPENAACIIYTSGSTGEPKGILMDNRSIVNLVYSFIQSYAPGPADNILPLNSIASASFVGEILPIAASGGGIVLAHRVHFLDMKKLMQLLADYRVTILSTVPSMIARLNAGQWNPGKLRLLLSGGETLSAGDIDRLQETVTIVNGYGLTEATICSTYIIVNEHRMDSSTNPVITVGRPIINTQVYILDQHRNPVPIGVRGEIYIGGDGLSRGYLNNPELTAQKFINYKLQNTNYKQTTNYHVQNYKPNAIHAIMQYHTPPHSPITPLPHSPIYRTGDLGCWLADGTIKFLGRMDTQVQIHGYRIELSEIENHLGLHPDIQDVAVIDREILTGDRRLVAYFVTVCEEGKKRISPDSSLLRDWLSKRIPGYMIPGIFVEVESMPLNANGKVDINALPVPSPDRPELKVDYKAPKTETEKAIASVWLEFLHLEKAGINDNFFDLGGHSLLLTQVHSRLSEMYQNKKELTIVDLFRYPTILSLAEYIDEGEKTQQSREIFREIQYRAAKKRQAFSSKRFARRKK
jgi:amino acid adenylation domain-containing protein